MKSYKTFCIRDRRDEPFQLQLFGSLESIDIVVSVKSLLTEMTMSIYAKIPNGLSFKCSSAAKEQCQNAILNFVDGLLNEQFLT